MRRGCRPAVALAVALLSQVACERTEDHGPVESGRSEKPSEIVLAENRRSENAPELVAALERGDPAVRARAALAMARIQSSAYSEPLIRAAQDDSIEVRLAALFALGQLGLAEGANPPPAVGSAVSAALHDSDPVVVAAALEALGKLASSSTAESVTPFLDHDDPDVRVQAAMALFRVRFVPLWRKEQEAPPELPADSVAALIRHLDDPVERVRRAAAYGFSRFGQPEAVTALAAKIGEADEWTRLFAIRAIARSGGSRAPDEIRAATMDPSYRVRTEALQALAALGAADRIDPLLADDDSFHVRAALAAALGQAESAGSLATLARLMGDAAPTVHAAAIEALARRRGGDYRAELKRALGDDAWMVRAAGARAAAALGRAGLPLVRRAWADEDLRVRTAAIEAAGILGEEAEALVLEALGSSDLALRGTAVDVLSRRGAEGSDKLTLLRGAYEDSPGREWIEVRESIVGALDELEAAGEFLVEVAARDAAASVRNRARRLLLARGVDSAAVESIPIELSAQLGVRFDDDPLVVLVTSRGPIEIRCLSREAPVHVAQFVRLVREGFYDGLIWHRVVSNFVIQGGDPRGDGWGSAGESLRDEINRVPYLRGAVGMPKAGKDSGSCQIFITHIPTPHLDGNYTVYGLVESGLDVVDRIQVGDRIERAYVAE